MGGLPKSPVPLMQNNNQVPNSDEDNGLSSGNGRRSNSLDLTVLYKHSHDELNLQQSKRDQIISLYLTICTIAGPLVFSYSFDWRYKGIIFLALGFIGTLLAVIVIRYKIYKEVYWTCCQTLSQLMRYDPDKIDKKLIQDKFLSVLTLRGKKYVEEKNGKKVFLSFKFFKSNLFSAETLMYVVLIFIVAMMSGVGIGLVLLFNRTVGIAVGIGFGAFMFVILLLQFFRQNKKLYRVLVDGENDSFNSVFEKAWFLYFYE